MKEHTQNTFATENGDAAIPQGLPLSDICRIQQSFHGLEPHTEQFVGRFYQVLFEKFPDLHALFPVGNLSRQQTRFQEGLQFLISHLEHPQALRAALIKLGEQHQGYGITLRHYPPVVDTFLQILIEMGGGRINGQTYVAWANFLHLIRAIMLEPYVQGSLPEGQQKQSSGADGPDRSKRILLIDDDHQLLDLYQSYLEHEGYFCSQTSDVAWAFTHLQLSRYHLVLTDFQMPVMNGVQLRIHLSQLESVSCPPFVLVTGKPDQEIKKFALESGFVAVIKKPHVLTELGSLVESTLKKS